MKKKTPDQLRSARWTSPDDLRSFGHRSRIKQMGYAEEEFRGRPVIGIVNTWNGFNTCHTHFPERVQDISRGVMMAGGLPIELPALSLGEQLMKPTTMMYRNLLAMEVEELGRSYPVDGLVLMVGCDKTTPGALMGALTLDLPTIVMPAGPMVRGIWRGKTLASGTDVWKHWDDRRAGLLSREKFAEIEYGIARSAGTCMSMGTAATMMSMAEALGMALPGSSAIPAVDSSHKRMASASGARLVEMIWEDMKPSGVLSSDSFHNAIVTDMAIGGSTNAIIHLTAMARRAGTPLALEDFDRISAGVPLLANVQPSGEHVMEDFYFAGGLPALLSRITERLKLDARTVNGKTLGENIAEAEVFNDDVIRPLDNPVNAAGSTVILRGNLAPGGAVMKASAAEERLWSHTGPARVFDDIRELKAWADADDADVTADTVLILRGTGPVGAPGMPEWGQLPVPKKLLEQGVRDIVRISDCRMSGTSYGACVLHVAPESAVGGPLALVHDGDMVELDIRGRSLSLLVDDAELERRKTTFAPKRKSGLSGYARLYVNSVMQADAGCDFDFMDDQPGAAVEPDIF